MGSGIECACACSISIRNGCGCYLFGNRYVEISWFCTSTTVSNLRSMKSRGRIFSSAPRIVSRPINSLSRVGSRWIFDRIFTSICLRIKACRPYNTSNSSILDLNSSQPLLKRKDKERNGELKIMTRFEIFASNDNCKENEPRACDAGKISSPFLQSAPQDDLKGYCTWMTEVPPSSGHQTAPCGVQETNP